MRRACVALTACLASLCALSVTPVRARAATPVCDNRAVTVQAVPALRISGTYCHPGASRAGAIFVLVPGGTYNRGYWDFGYKPGTYSFARALARSGYAAFAIDPLGNGESTRPLSVALTGALHVTAISRVIGHLRRTGFDGTAYDTVLLGGHSQGSMLSVMEAATFRDVDGLLVTGLTHRWDYAAALEFFTTGLYQASQDPKFAGLGLDPGYQTTRPGVRYSAFHAPGTVEPGVVAEDEATKDVVAPFAIDALLLGGLSPYSVLVDAPVLLAIGDRDGFYCTPSASDCSSVESLLAEERPKYAKAPCLDALVMPGAGHDLNLHPAAPAYQAAVVEWADRVTAGECRSNP